MEHADNQSDAKPMPARRKRRRELKWRLLGGIIAIAVIFTAGIQVGRGDIHIRGLSVASASSTRLNYSGLDQIYGLLNKDFDGSLNNTKLIDGAKQGLVAATGDPYTEYFNPTDAKAFNDELSGAITGIGAEIGTDPSGNIQVVSPISGYPAAKAGLQPKDLIVGIDGQSTQGMSVDAAVAKIRGKAGTSVKLTLVRGSGNAFTVAITRAKITIPSVTWSEDSNNIGYLKISQFTNDTVSLAQKAAIEFKDKNVKGVVLDLRGNPGGYLTGAVNVSSLWLDQGKTVVSERRGVTVVDSESATGNNPLKGLPTVVLIDGGSASASEITAGALHDNGAATLVGVQSFGKGSVQQVINLPDGSEIKITIAHWYTPAGININKKGITPDKVVPITDAQAQAGQDLQKDAAYQILQAKLH